MISRSREFDLVRSKLETCITFLAYLLCDQLDSPPPAKPPTLVLRLWHGMLHSHSSCTLRALLAGEVLSQVVCGRDLLFSNPHLQSWTYLWSHPLCYNFSTSCFKWWQSREWYSITLWYLYHLSAYVLITSPLGGLGSGMSRALYVSCKILSLMMFIRVRRPNGIDFVRTTYCAFSQW